MYTGKCLCGEVEVVLKGAISDIIHCHCSLCRKSSGTAFATNGFIQSSDFEVVKGKEKLSSFTFKPGRIRHFCSACGSPVYSENLDDPSRLRLRLGILESDIIERPISHNFVSSQANWEDLDAGLPRYDTFEPSRQK
ncbi:GFA family protein [Pseudoalteromonas sp. C2R02]|uniref:GFA family protein n=1 Tax=Pseudoalteromonas sp. C2R02 TaxID=2841565 RepID=UPI001C08A928|nr:GFA family protein [Pseudoalteromonas sp. C2R02]MBU2971443.1 GFA family protein [Pseudoalteromonas sp. C2R02]